MNFQRFLVIIFLFSLMLGIRPRVFGQKSIADSVIGVTLAQITYRGMIPGGDMRDRFGFVSEFGIDMVYKFNNNFYISTGFHGMFTDSIKEPGLLDNLKIPFGFVLDDNGIISNVRIQGTGFVVPLSVGKVFPIIDKHNPNSGLYVELGGRFMQHRIRINSIENDISALEGEYVKGYDRLTNGFGIKEVIGYRYLANNGTVNFTVGFEFSQNFTQNRRSVFFDTGEIPKLNRQDLLSGFFVSWIFPFYERAPNKVYYK